jgi:hypothetical protein
MFVFSPDNLLEHHRTLSLDFWDPDLVVPKSWLYDSLSHFAKSNIQHINVGLRNVFYHNGIGSKHLVGFFEGLRNEPEKWKGVRTYSLTVRLTGGRYANPSGPVFWVSSTDVYLPPKLMIRWFRRGKPCANV